MPDPALQYPSARKVDEALRSLGLTGRVRELPESARTAEEAARALGCEVRQIVKTLVFRRPSSGNPLLALVAGDHRLDERWIEHRLGERWERVEAEDARSLTGYAIGGVPPIGHPRPLPTYVDYDLLEQRELWAAAGHPHAVCRLAPDELLRITGGHAVPVVPLTPDAGEGGWISFDCYGTLIDWRRGFLDSAATVLGALSGPEGAALFRGYQEEERAVESGEYRSYREVMTFAAHRAAEQIGRTTDRRAAESVVESIPDWPPFDDVADGLRALRAGGYRLAILSNIDRDLLDGTIRAQGWSVDLVVTADEVRSYKPALAHWIRFLKRTGIRPSEGVHVAAGYEYDLPPAAQLGFGTVYVGRDPAASSGPAASTVVTNLRELVNALPTVTRGRPD
jgi:2-haloalkanoic acid dehalogenase type II